MSFLQLATQAAIAAAELFALAISPPAFAADATARRSGATVQVSLADGHGTLRFEQQLANHGATPLDIARALPRIDDHVSALRIARNGREVDLIGAGGCDFADDAAHVRLAVDEAIADVLTLPPGETAQINIEIEWPLAAGDSALRLQVPWLAPPTQTRLLLIEDGSRAALLVVVDHRQRGRATLQLRPADGPGRHIELGALDGSLFVVALASRVEAEQLVRGAVELELVNGDGVVWATLPVEFAFIALSAAIAH